MELPILCVRGEAVAGRRELEQMEDGGDDLAEMLRALVSGDPAAGSAASEEAEGGAGGVGGGGGLGGRSPSASCVDLPSCVDSPSSGAALAALLAAGSPGAKARSISAKSPPPSSICSSSLLPATASPRTHSIGSSSAWFRVLGF